MYRKHKIQTGMNTAVKDSGRRPFGRIIFIFISFSIFVASICSLFVFAYGVFIDTEIDLVTNFLSAWLGHFILGAFVGIFIAVRCLRKPPSLFYTIVQAVWVWCFFAFCIVYAMTYQMTTMFGQILPDFKNIYNMSKILVMNEFGIFMLAAWLVSAVMTWVILRFARII